MKEGPAWSNVPTALVRDPGLTPTGKLAALALGCHTRPTFDATVSHGVLAATVAVSLRTIRRGLKELETHGWVVVQRTKLSNRENAVNVYRWNFNQAQLAIERMRKGRATRSLAKPTPSATTDPTPSAKNGGEGRVTGDTHTNCSYTIPQKRGERPALRLERSGPTPLSGILPDILPTGWTPEQEAELLRATGGQP